MPGKRLIETISRHFAVIGLSGSLSYPIIFSYILCKMVGKEPSMKESTLDVRRVPITPFLR